ncbi:hypothetical protein NQ317_002367 [Molorchus minor]|uniref:Uncharacterized protein n=1 Tax=Molorchus minor TaxID=1323400 RepID=A0ABQ9JWN4_9CUCU|nr:hypothetical protein NQ317_002367 [Molorchus minor]
MYLNKERLLTTVKLPIKEPLNIMKYPQLVSMPSAVSDWLEEQLEARGIDAVVYTRYVLSLLHTHTIDVIYPDEDLQFSRLKKEVKRSSGGRKRVRNSSEWWRHAQADAEQIKRSAAVECLMSASDQNCEIESLVDELCEKLKEVNGKLSSHSDSTSTLSALKEPEKQKTTPQELAERYYAAFPPLCPQSSTKLISLLPKWKPPTSPIRKKAVKKYNRQLTYETKMHNGNDAMRAFRAQKARKNSNQMQRAAPNIQETLDQCVEANRDILTNDGDEMKMYEDLPVDIKDLLESPSPQDNAIELMNQANMKDSGKTGFIPYRTNITSSIWSNEQDVYDNKFNASIGSPNSESMLDLQFSSITINSHTKSDNKWPILNMCTESEANTIFENNNVKRSLFLEGFHSLPCDWKEFAMNAKEECFENEHLLNHIAISLMKINHNKEKSCFTEVIPRLAADSQSFKPFSKTNLFGFGAKCSLTFEKEREDLLTSERSHFRPINEKVDNYTQSHYADGATFVISNSLDKVEYKRSESGSMLLENEYGQSKKYYKYKFFDDDSAPLPDAEFVLKFSICQNDKASQTEELCELDFETVMAANTKSPRDGELSYEDAAEEISCTCPTDGITSTDSLSFNCLVHPTRPESMLSEILWNRINAEWDNKNLRNIWNGGEICESCLASNECGDRPPPSSQNTQLREDISQDGEQLLSDLSSLQKTYMEELPVAEVSYDISELMSLAAPKERKRRHSFIVDDGLQGHGSWSFASRLEEDCLIQMSTLPTLRSITL